MKVIGKTQDGFLVEMSSTELNRIATGKNNPDNFNSDKSVGSEIKISQMFDSVREIESFKTGEGYQSVRKQLQDLLNAFVPVEGFIEQQQQTIKGMK